MQVSPAAQPCAALPGWQKDEHVPPAWTSWRQTRPSPHVVTPMVFWQAEPLVPAPLVRQAKVPLLSLTEQVCPAPQLNGSVEQELALSEEEEQATTDEVTVAVTKRRESTRRLPET